MTAITRNEKTQSFLYISYSLGVLSYKGSCEGAQKGKCCVSVGV